VAVVGVCLAVGLAASWRAERVDNYAYDTMSERVQLMPRAPQSVVVAIDEATLEQRHGVANMRGILAEALDKLAEAKPKLVALDVTLHDEGEDQVKDTRLAAALLATRNLILPSELAGEKWSDPAPRFRSGAIAIGHVHFDSDRKDGVGRAMELEKSAAGVRRWALSMEAFRVWRRSDILESPTDLEVGGTLIPASRETSRRLLVRYLPAGDIPTVSVLEIAKQHDLLRDKAVFLGVTALSAANDRLLNPYQQNVPGVEFHAHAFETLLRGKFLSPARGSTVVLVCVLFAAAMGVVFGFLSGWPAYLIAVALLASAFLAPYEFFKRGTVLPFLPPVAVAWITSAGAATYQHFFVRRRLRQSESEKSRYQQAIHWAAHEMRTPLTAIQGSSEIMSRYNLPEAKRNQLSEMINSESKRLSRIIQTFLDVERLAEGQMELKREPFEAASVVDACMLRVTPIAERKQIKMFLDSPVDGTLVGDRELMEYAFYNLLTNAVKYSPAETEVHVTSDLAGSELRLAVRDQGIGMDQKELKRIFQKFYRTKRAEASGEVGTGIGLSIVEQIVTHHGGRIDVTSEPGKGSCFTMVLRIQPA
jgi:signal transduction histidine kinase